MKTALVSGGTSGVGLSIVKELVKNNFKVFFIGSDLGKGNKIAAELKNDTTSEIHFIQLDLSNLKEVNKFANSFKVQNERLDVLLNIAGVVLPEREETAEGIEKTFAIGYLSAFILCNDLLPLLEKTKNSRILNVSGDPSLILKAKLNFDDLNFAKKYNGYRTAITTVHAKTVLTEILSEKFSGKNIDVNSFHPGIVKSDLTRNLPFILRMLVNIVNPFMPNESKTGIFVSISDTINGISGKLFINKKPISLHFDKAYKDRLWNETEKLISNVLSK